MMPVVVVELLVAVFGVVVLGVVVVGVVIFGEVVLVVVLLVIVFSVLEVLVQRRREGEIYGAHLVGNYLTNGLKMVRTSTTMRNTFNCN